MSFAQLNLKYTAANIAVSTLSGVFYYYSPRISKYLIKKHVLPYLINNGYKTSSSFIANNFELLALISGTAAFAAIFPKSSQINKLLLITTGLATVGCFAYFQHEYKPAISLATLLGAGFAISVYNNGSLKESLSNLYDTLDIASFIQPTRESKVIYEPSKIITSANFLNFLGLLTSISIGVGCGVNTLIPKNLSGTTSFLTLTALSEIGVLIAIVKLGINLPKNKVFGEVNPICSKRLALVAATATSLSCWAIADYKIPLIIGLTGITTQYVFINNIESFSRAVKDVAFTIGF